MRRPGKHLPHHYLKPGGVFIAQEPTVVTTLLGSCVAVTMFHPRRRIGAICHGLLPSCREGDAGQCDRNCVFSFKFMDCSIRRMLEKFKAVGITPREMEIKLFGGADMFGVPETDDRRMTIGRQNVTITRQILDDERLPVLVEDVGGERGRKIFFYTHTGEILLKRLSNRP